MSGSRIRRQEAVRNMGVAQESRMSEHEPTTVVPEVLWTGLDGIICRADEAAAGLVGTSVGTLPYVDAEGRATLSLLVTEAREGAFVEATVQVELPYTSRTSMTARALRVVDAAGTVRVVLSLSRQRGVPDLRRLRELDHLAGVGRIALGAAHDLNNVMLVLGMGLQDLAVLPEAAPLAERVRELGDMAQRATCVVRRFRTNAPVLPTHVGVVELGDLLRESHRTLSMLAGARMRLAVNSTSWPIRVRAGRQALEQALMNLVSNASDAASKEGHIVVTATQTRWPGGRVCSGGHLRAGTYGVLEVADDGPGLSPAQLARVFEPFYTTKPVGVGTGLGLTLVAETALEAGGGVLAESPPGAGAIFRILLPVVA
jgi:signal transduction histidine kinase